MSAVMLPVLNLKEFNAQRYHIPFGCFLFKFAKATTLYFSIEFTPRECVVKQLLTVVCQYRKMLWKLH